MFTAQEFTDVLTAYRREFEPQSVPVALLAKASGVDIALVQEMVDRLNVGDNPLIYVDAIGVKGFHPSFYMCYKVEPRGVAGDKKQAFNRRGRKKIVNRFKKNFGNRCGYDPVNVIIPNKLPDVCAKRTPLQAVAFKRIPLMFKNLKELFPEVNKAGVKTAKNDNSMRLKRGERREAICRLCLTMLAVMNIYDLQIRGFTLEKLASLSGISFSRAERAYRDMQEGGLLKKALQVRKYDAVKKEFEALPSVKGFTMKFFRAFGLVDILGQTRRKLRALREKKLYAAAELQADFSKLAQDYEYENLTLLTEHSDDKLRHKISLAHIKAMLAEPTESELKQQQKERERAEFRAYLDSLGSQSEGFAT